MALLLAGCLGSGCDPGPAQGNTLRYREEGKHGSASAQAILAVWPWVTEPPMNATGNIVATEDPLGSIDRPEGRQNATFVLEWDSTDPQPLFMHAGLEISRIDTWATVDGTSPLTLTIDENDWQQSEARLRFRAHDPDIAIDIAIDVAHYTSIESNLNMPTTCSSPKRNPPKSRWNPPRVQPARRVTRKSDRPIRIPCATPHPRPFDPFALLAREGKSYSQWEGE